jgi:putative transposase
MASWRNIFFTVNCLQRKDNDLLIRNIGLLRAVIAKVKNSHPFNIHAWVVLPEHMHCVIELPTGDDDFSFVYGGTVNECTLHLLW